MVASQTWPNDHGPWPTIVSAAVGLLTGAIVGAAGEIVQAINAQGERTIANHRDKRLDTVTPVDADRLVSDIDILLVDNRYPTFVTPICEAACRRGLAVVMTARSAPSRSAC